MASSRAVVAQLRRLAPGSCYATAMAPPCAAQALQALRVISGAVGGDVGERKLKAIRENANYFREELSKRGFKVGGGGIFIYIYLLLRYVCDSCISMYDI